MAEKDPTVWPFLINGSAVSPINMISGLSRGVVDQFANWSHETNRFLAKRLEKDAKLQGQLARTDSPSQALDVYMAFLMEAAEDYRTEFNQVAGMMIEAGHTGWTLMDRASSAEPEAEAQAEQKVEGTSS